MRIGIFPALAAMVAAAVFVFSIFAIAQADDEKSGSEAAFSDNGLYIPPGESREVMAAGDCKLLTNRDERIGFYFTPSRSESWPSVDRREALEPIVTEAPCK